MIKSPETIRDNLENYKRSELFETGKLALKKVAIILRTVSLLNNSLSVKLRPSDNGTTKLINCRHCAGVWLSCKTVFNLTYNGRIVKENIYTKLYRNLGCGFSAFPDRSRKGICKTIWLGQGSHRFTQKKKKNLLSSESAKLWFLCTLHTLNNRINIPQLRKEAVSTL